MATNTTNGTIFYYNDITNPKDIRKTVVNIDSRFRNSYADSTSNFSYDIATTIKNIARIRLVSAEIPNTFFTFTNKRKNTFFYLVVGTTGYKVTIDEGNYTIPQLKTAIQSKLTQINSLIGTNFEIIVNEYNAKFTIQDTGSPPIAFSLDFGTEALPRPVYYSLGYYMGFRNKVYTGLTSYTTEAVPDLVGDPYVLIDVNDYPSLRHVSRSVSLTAFAKIVVKENKYFTIFADENSMLSKEYIFTQPTNLSQFRIRILDQYGEQIDLNGADISLAFEVSEITNSTLYQQYLNYQG